MRTTSRDIHQRGNSHFAVPARPKARPYRLRASVSAAVALAAQMLFVSAPHADASSVQGTECEDLREAKANQLETMFLFEMAHFRSTRKASDTRSKVIVDDYGDALEHYNREAYARFSKFVETNCKLPRSEK